MSTTCPPWCGCHGNGCCLETAHWTFSCHGRLEAKCINLFQLHWRLSIVLNGNFVILDHPQSLQCCQNLVSIRYFQSEIFQFYDFASLAGKCLTTPPFGSFRRVWTSQNCGSPSKPPKGTSLGEDRSFKWVTIKTSQRHIVGWGQVI